MQSLQAGQTNYRKPTLATASPLRRWSMLFWLVMLLLGQYRSRHGGTELLTSIAMVGICITNAGIGLKARKEPGERAVRWCFGLIAAAFALHSPEHDCARRGCASSAHRNASLFITHGIF